VRFGTWNVSNLCELGSFTAASRELARCKLDLVGLQEVRWDKRGPGKRRSLYIFYGEGKENLQLGKGFLEHHRIESEVKRVDFVSDRM